MGNGWLELRRLDVDAAHPIPTLHQVLCQVVADEPASPGHENSSGLIHVLLLDRILRRPQSSVEVLPAPARRARASEPFSRPDGSDRESPDPHAGSSKRPTGHHARCGGGGEDDRLGQQESKPDHERIPVGAGWANGVPGPVGHELPEIEGVAAVGEGRVGEVGGVRAGRGARRRKLAMGRGCSSWRWARTARSPRRRGTR